MVHLNAGGNYLKVEEVVDGGLIKFLDEGTWIESTKFKYDDGNPKQDFVMKVEYNGTEYNARINKISRDELLPAYGPDTSKWVGKEAKVTIETYRTLGTKGLVFTPPKPTGQEGEW